GYLNSFLIEPVVRQARRFSRPNTDDNTQPSSDHGTEALARGEGLLLDGEWSRDRRPLTAYSGISSTDLTLQSSTQAASAGSEQLDATLRARRDNHRRTNVAGQRIVSQEEDVVLGSRPSPRPSIGPTSNNPEYHSSRSLGSTTSSISSSIQLILDASSIGPQDSSQANQQNAGGGGGDGPRLPVGDQMLPEDDGMGSMRQRIFAVQRAEASSTEKAKLVHQLMNEQYSTSQASLHAPQPSQARSPSSPASHGRPITPSSLHSVDQSACCTSPPTSTSSLADARNPFNVFPEDLKPTFYQKLLPSGLLPESDTRLSDRRWARCEEEMKSFGRSIVNMEIQFRHLERSIESQPMPREFQDTKAWIYCNDCNAKSSVKYHWLGLKCGVCDSYNTAQLQMERAPNSVGNAIEPVPSPSDSLHSPGRGSEIAAQYQRLASSAPPSTMRRSEHNVSRRTAHSQEPQTTNHRLSTSISDLGSGCEDSIDTGSNEEYSEVDFWGLESPSSRDRTALPDGAMNDDSEDIDDGQDDTDDEMSDGDLDDLLDDEDDDQMEIFGHR
ncbi:MAG: hypothetical protein Q9220_004292, partial [cf. Caloplaca sp. 1 TL-2023]